MQTYDLIEILYDNALGFAIFTYFGICIRIRLFHYSVMCVSECVCVRALGDVAFLSGLKQLEQLQNH